MNLSETIIIVFHNDEKETSLYIIKTVTGIPRIVQPLRLEAVPAPASGVPRVMVLVEALWVAASPLTEAQDPQQNTESQEIR